jgi:8-oxo-dGTP pyrophosphatase MutT (NUDIX family)
MELKPGICVKEPMFKLVSRLVLQPYSRQRRGLTLGTRTLVTDASRVLLVRHTYAPGWMLPGGGVERGETIFQSAARELREEAGIIAGEEPRLLGLCLNDRVFPGDHVAVLRLETFTRLPFTPNREIAEADFFDLSSLPEGTTGGTRRRIAEAIEGRMVAAVW